MPGRRRCSNRRRQKRKFKKPASPDGEWWSIRQIVDERTVKSKVEYLVDWEDNQDTGEAYPPSWVPAPDVLDDAIEEWETKKQSSPTPEASSQAVPESVHETDDSQPPRPANYRTLQRPNISAHRKRPNKDDEEEEEDDDAPRKRARLEAASPSLEPVPSITSSASFESAYEEPPIQRLPQYLAVEIKNDPGFDASEYLSVPGSQSTAAHSSQPLSELESQDQRIAIVSHRSQGTIPDSQDPSSLEAVESQRRETQHSSELNPVVIPDSQDVEGDKSLPHKITTRPQTPASGSNGRPNRPHEEIISGSTGIESDIPSRQPDQYHSVESPDLSAEKANDQGTRQSSSLPTTPRASQQTQNQTGPEPVFYTHPNINIASQALQASQGTNTQEQDGVITSGEGLVQDLRCTQLEEAGESTPGVSQAAQVIHRPYELSEGQSLESHSTKSGQRHISPLDSGSKGPPVGSTSQSIRPAKQRASIFLPRALEAFDRGKNPPELEMFGEREDTSPDRGVSAVNQLQSLWDEAPIEEAEQDPGTEGHSSAAAELAALSASEAQDDRSREPERTSPAAYFTQPPQHTGTWGSPATFSDQAAGGDPMASGTAIGQSQRSAVDSLQDLVNQTFGPSEESSSEALMLPPSFNIHQGTVSPADVSKPVEAEKTTLALLPSLSEGVSSGAYGASGNSITMAQVPPTHEESPESPVQDLAQMDHVVTLPFQASIRDQYIETIYKHKDAAKEFGDLFANEIYQPPDESLIKRIDELFNRLQNLCDYPEDILGTAIESLPPDEKMKYSLDANPKFNFLFELLKDIKNDTSVLIIARSLNLLRPLVELVEILELDCTCDALGRAAKDTFRNSPVRVTLALPDTADPSRFDVVVGYDSAFNHSAMSTKLAVGGAGKSDQKHPLVLRLTTAFSIEHIDLEMPVVSNGLERKGAMLVGVTKARGLIRDPPRLPEPYEIAKVFLEYLNGETDTILWEPDQLPDQVLDVFFSSQAISQRPRATPDAENGRKRKHDEEDDAEAKRMRRFSTVGIGSTRTAPPLTTAVQGLLEKSGFKDTMTNEAQLSVPLSVLEALAAKMAEAERAAEANNLDSEYKMIIDQLDKRVKGYEASAEQIYEKHRSALEDRTQFEAQTRKAETALQVKTEDMRKAEEKSAAKIAELEAKIARLTDDAATGSSLGATNKLLQEATEKNRVLEKQLQNSRGEKDYVMEQYQQANTHTMAMRREIEDLKKQKEELEKKASDNLRNINEIQKKNTARELVRKIAELETRLKEREIELDRVRDELRQLKNGRRETRQVSVPRSPRMGIMSPRGPPRGVSGSASRGASPSPAMGGFDPPAGTSGVPVMQFTHTQAGNGRWNPLR